MSTTTDGVTEPILQLRNASAGYGDRTLWRGLDLAVSAGEFIAVLGANGAGKSTLLRTILGLQPLQTGDVRVAGVPAHRGSDLVGYIPQERRLAPSAPIRVRDLIGFGVDGRRWGIGLAQRRTRRRLVDRTMDEVGVGHLADTRPSELSGGEQQRVRIAQALVTDPRLLLCDEPLLSLDLRRSAAVTELINTQRRERRTGVVFVTHDINPVLPYVDRVLYLTGDAWRIGTVDEVMTTESLSALYGARVNVAHVDGQLLVSSVPESVHHDADRGEQVRA